MDLKSYLQVGATFLQSLPKKEFQKYLAASLAALCAITFGIIYFVYNTRSDLHRDLKKLNDSANKIAALIEQNEQLKKAEIALRTSLDANPVDMKLFFEKFCAKHGLTQDQAAKPEKGRSIPSAQGDVKFREVSLKANFKNQTMQKLVDVLKDICLDETIYLKQLEITREGQKINFEITLATREYEKETTES